MSEKLETLLRFLNTFILIGCVLYTGTILMPAIERNTDSAREATQASEAILTVLKKDREDEVCRLKSLEAMRKKDLQDRIEMMSLARRFKLEASEASKILEAAAKRGE